VHVSFEELSESWRQAARSLSREEAVRRVALNARLAHPAAADIRARMLALLDRPDPSARAQCAQLVQEMVAATGMLVRPGTVEELWELDGLLDRACLSGP
jgi:hypothetical protein